MNDKHVSLGDRNEWEWHFPRQKEVIRVEGKREDEKGFSVSRLNRRDLEKDLGTAHWWVKVEYMEMSVRKDYVTFSLSLFFASFLSFISAKATLFRIHTVEQSRSKSLLRCLSRKYVRVATKFIRISCRHFLHSRTRERTLTRKLRGKRVVVQRLLQLDKHARWTQRVVK